MLPIPYFGLKKDGHIPKWYRPGFILGLTFSIYFVSISAAYAWIYFDYVAESITGWRLSAIAIFSVMLVMLSSFSYFHFSRSFCDERQRVKWWWKEGHSNASFIGMFIVFTSPLLYLEDSLPIDNFLLKALFSIVIGYLASFITDQLFIVFSESPLANFFGNLLAVSITLILHAVFIIALFTVIV